MIATIAEAAERIRRRELSPVDLVSECLARIERHDHRYDSFIRVLADEALAAARLADAQIAAGDYRGPLHGIPFAAKDIIDVEGLPTTCGSGLRADHRAAEDALCIARLKNAGAILVGKTMTWEFATGGPSDDVPFPPARNAWNHAKDANGSSTGSGTAVAAGFALAALGTDTGGSIRGPSSVNGLAGIKPTYDLVSRAGVFPLSWTLDHIGPMAWTAKDCALMLQVLTGTDFTPDRQVRGLRVGVVRHFYEVDSPADPAVSAAMEGALGVLRDLGCQVSDVSLPPLALFTAASMVNTRAEAYAIHEADLKARPLAYGALARRRLMSGAFLSGADYVNALRQRARLTAQVAEVMKTVDVLITPAQDAFPPDLGGNANRIGGNYLRPFNLTGQPAMSVCCAFSDDGLPLGLQIVGRPYEDDLVLALGHAFERAAGLRDRRPSLET